MDVYANLATILVVCFGCYLAGIVTMMVLIAGLLRRE